MWSGLLRANAAYAAGSAANSAALLVLVPYLVRRLSVAEYGAFSLFEVSILLFNLLMLGGADAGLMREHWALSDESERRELAGTVALATLGWSVGLGAVLAAIGGGVAAWWPQLRVSPTLQLGVAFAIGIAAAETLFTLLLSVFRIRERPLTFVLLSIVRVFAGVGLMIAGVEAGGGVNGALCGRLGAAVLGVLGALACVRSSLSLSWRWDMLRRVLRYGLPILPASLAGYVLVAADRYLLQRVSSLEVVATYSFAYKIASVLETLVTRPFGLDWAPRRFRISTEPDAGSQYNLAMLFCLFVASACALGLLAVTPSVYAWLAPPSYAVGQSLVPILLGAYLIAAVRVPLNVGIMLQDQTRVLPRLAWGAALGCVLLNLAFIPTFGMTGAAWVAFASHTGLTIAVTWVSLRLYPITYAWSTAMLIVAGLALGGAGLWVLSKLFVAPNEVVALAVRLIWAAAVSGGIGLYLWRMQRRSALSSGALS